MAFHPLRLVRRGLRPAAVSFFLLCVGCPHRTPVFSPDGQRVLILAGAAGEDVEKPASQLWLLHREEGTYRPARLRAPESGREVRFLATRWLDNRSFLAWTTEWEDDEAIEETAAIWRVTDEGKDWSKLDLPAPSAERTPRRGPVLLDGEGKDASRTVVYASGDEKVVAASLAGGAPRLEIEPAEMVGPAPDDGFLLYRPNDDTGDIDLHAYGSDLKARWQRSFSKLAAQIGARLGVARSEIVFNDANTSTVIDGDSVGVQLVFTDVSWKDGVSGYYAVLSAARGELLAVERATCYPGDPGVSRAEGGLWAWAVTPTKARDSKTGTIRSFFLGDESASGRQGASLELAGIDRKAIHGYGLSPDAKSFAVIINGPETRVRFYPVEASQPGSQPAEVILR